MSIPVAIGFMLNGLGLLVLYNFRFRTTQAIGVLILLLAGLAVLDLILFFNSVENSPFRPMAPMTAFGFSLAGLAFFAGSDHRRRSTCTLIYGVLGTVIFAIGVLALIAHLLDLSPTEGWGHILRMAVHAPGGFGILAVGLISFAWQNEPQKVIGSPQWLPILVGVGIITLTLGLWIHLDDHQHSFVPTAVLIFGLLMAGLLSIAVYFIQRERRWVGQISLSHKGLEKEVSERTRVEAQLRHSQEELRNLSNRLQSIREEEKTKIAREVHDELGQVLTVLKMDLSCLEEELSDSPKAIRDTIHSMADQIDRTVETVQRICLELRPKVLDVFGLAEAIEWQTTEFQKRTGIHVQLVMDSRNLMVDSERAVTCFRVLQEALTNVARHAEATEVRIHLGQQNGFCHLDVHDNGKGIADRDVANSHSLGLIGIRERVLHLDGELTITGRPGEGTHLSIRVPSSKS